MGERYGHRRGHRNDSYASGASKGIRNKTRTGYGPMNATRVAPDNLKVIEDTLRNFPRMAPVSSVLELAADDPGKPRRFLVRKVDDDLWIRVAEQLDLHVDAMLRDDELSNLGLIVIVPPAVTDDWLRQRVGEAVSMRHLLIEQVRPGMDHAGKLVYSIELVFAIPSPPPAAGVQTPNLNTRLGEVFRKIIREAGYLHALGVNVWRLPSDAQPADPTAIRRAFPWLLKDTGEWYDEVIAKSETNHREFAEMTSVELENFRIPG